MPVYSVNRRRAIILLVLSSVLLLTLDVRGNAIVNRMRNAFSHVLTPFVTAGDVIATPIKNIWHGATDYQDLRRENEELRQRVAQQTGAELAASAYVSDHQAILALLGLQANYPSVTARVVGGQTSNFQQTIEIDRGTRDNIVEGMAVVSAAGLVGKVTTAYDDRSVVLLITDPEYVVPCKVSGTAEAEAEAEAEDGDETDTTGVDSEVGESGEVDDPDAEETNATTPSGEQVSDLSTTTTVAPTTTTTIPGGDPDGDTPTSGSGTSTTAIGTTTTTVPVTTTTAPLVARETGGCEGRGPDSLPVMKFVIENPLEGPIGIGDVITTAGGETSLAPPDLVIGTVVNKIERASSAGPLLEIELAADLDHLSIVQVVRYQPRTEVPG